MSRKGNTKKNPEKRKRKRGGTQYTIKMVILNDGALSTVKHVLFLWSFEQSVTNFVGWVSAISTNQRVIL